MPKQQLPKILVVCGPTGSGKSSLALALASKFNGEIIIADSRQLFEGMVIGTNSPTPKEQKKIPHHLCNEFSPKEKFNAARYKELAEEKISEILSQKKLPILVGGTGLYIKSLVDNFDFSKTASNETLRKELEKKSLEDLLAQCDSLKSASLSESDRKNKRRVIRAIEIALSGSQKSTAKPKYEVLQIAPVAEREKLYQAIDARVLSMLQMGLEKEVRTLVKKYSWDIEALSGIGYREFRAYFEKEVSQEELVQKIQQDTRRYAKRQLTWFKADKRIHWVKSESQAEQLVQSFLK